MNSGDLHAVDYASGKPVRLSWRDGQIIDMHKINDAPEKEVWIAPPLFDLQINGYGGVDFQQDDISADALLAAVRALRRDGCAYFLLTLITDDWDRLLARLKRLRALRENSVELRSAIRGWQVEGPFLSDRPGFRGAHEARHMRDALPADIRELRAVTGTNPVLLTLAPERSGALEAIQLAASLGIRVSLGHTDANSETLRAAVAAGATGFTHLANGCPRELDRHDNIVWRVCDTPGLTVSFIPDGIHIPATAFRVLHKALAGPVYYTTDAMAAAGAEPGRYRIGAIDVEVGDDQIVRQPGKTNFAGSALRPCDGVFRAAKMLGCPWQECWRRLSETPAEFMGVSNQLEPGSPATFCLIEFSADEPRVRVIVNGA
jgi:N-acetylglucosamine-6-phosphate deacetylase